MANSSEVSSIECALLVEDTVARLRHDVFNCLAAVRNASFYIQRRVKGTELWQADPRIDRFFQLIAEQLDSAVARVSMDPKTELPHQRNARVVDAAECVQAVLAKLPAEFTARVRADVRSGRARVDPDELSWAIQQCISELSAANAIRVSGEPNDEGYTLRVEADGAILPAPTAPSGPLGKELALARRVAVAAGGRFSVESAERSTHIVMFLPSGAEIEEVKSVLIVDDEVAGRSTLAALLELEGFTVRECGSLGEATAQLNLGQRFDAVILDRKLPDGRGDGLATLVKQRLPLTKLILMTGEAVDQPPPGFDAAHQKGMDPATLTDLVCRLVEATAEAGVDGGASS